MPTPLTPELRALAPQAPSPAELARAGRVRPVLLYPDPMLRRLCEPVGHLDWAALCALAGDLLATMYAAGGRGLAAPQIGEASRIFVMDAGWKQGTPTPRIVLDPQILPDDAAWETLTETCLSIPDQPVAVSRPARITLSGFDMMGDLYSLPLDGIEARIAQHEADHLDGRLILDHADSQSAQGQIGQAGKNR